METSITKLTSQLKDCSNTPGFGELTSVEPLAGDASLRKYYRVTTSIDNFILMDSSNDPSLERFKFLTRYFLDRKVNVPNIFHEFKSEKHLLLTDFGDTTYDKLSKDNLDSSYLKAIDSLVDIAKIQIERPEVPAFSTQLLNEQMNIFKEWYLEKYLGVDISSEIDKKLNSLLNSLDLIFKTAPQTIVHMDYHSRNLIATDVNSPGIIDYQDTRVGPIGYDAISLWFDAYKEHSEEDISRWSKYYLDGLKSDIRYKFLSHDLLLNLCYMTGLQRLLKVLGIFARLKIKYNKPNYERYIPKVIKDINFILSLYPNMCSISEIISTPAKEKVV